MADYQRFVSYIYSYPGGVKDKNVGFAKVEVVRGEIRLNINLRGVYTDTPELFGVYLLFAGYNSGEYQLLKAGDCMVQNGMAVYKGIFNSSNIDSTGYAFSDCYEGHNANTLVALMQEYLALSGDDNSYNML